MFEMDITLTVALIFRPHRTIITFIGSVTIWGRHVGILQKQLFACLKLKKQAILTPQIMFVAKLQACPVQLVQLYRH